MFVLLTNWKGTYKAFIHHCRPGMYKGITQGKFSLLETRFGQGKSQVLLARSLCHVSISYSLGDKEPSKELGSCAFKRYPCYTIIQYSN